MLDRRNGQGLEGRASAESIQERGKLNLPGEFVDFEGTLHFACNRARNETGDFVMNNKRESEDCLPDS